jgi:hypothetical protein
MPSLNFIFRDLDVAAVHLSALVRTLPGTGLHGIVYYFYYDQVNQSAKLKRFKRDGSKHFQLPQLSVYFLREMLN